MKKLKLNLSNPNCENTKTNQYIKYSIFSLPLLLLIVYFLFIEEIQSVEIHASHSDVISNNEINFIAAGDYFCNNETIKTISNMANLDPELIITTGDHVKKNSTAECWFNISRPIDDKLRIAIGNHDMDYSTRYKQIVDHYKLPSPYYVHNFKNIHFISLSTEHPFEEGSKQFEFIKNDLDKVSKNQSIDWIIVHQHKPFYSTKQDKGEAEKLRDVYLKLFEKYDVDLVISSHNQYYERTYPITYNPIVENLTDKTQEPKPIITNTNKYFYPTSKGTIFLTVGTGGEALDKVKETHNYHVVQESAFGFLNIKLESNGKALVGTFYANNGNVLDRFELTELTAS